MVYTKRLFKICSALLAVMILFSGCGPQEKSNGENSSSSGSGSEEDTAVLRVAIQGEPQSLLTYDGGPLGASITDSLYNTLIFFNSTTNEFDPCLAESWELIDENTTRFYLRDDVYTVNGTQITTEDVLYTFQQGVNNPISQKAYSYYDIDNFELIDDFTIDIKTKTPNANAFSNLANPEFNIHCKKDVEAVGGIDALMQNPTDTSGAYVFTQWNPGEKIIMTRNENYWGDTPYYESIEVYFISDSTARQFALMSGDVDLITYVDASQVEELKGNENLTVVEQKTTSTVTMAFNCSQAPFDNELVRKAVACAINKEAILQVYAGGYGSEVDLLLPEAHMLYADVDSDVKYSYDPEQAKEYLAQAGLSDGFEFNLLLNSNYQKVAEIIQSNLSEIGVKVNIDTQEIAAWAEKSNSGDYQANMVVLFAGDALTPFYMIDGRTPHSSGGYCALPYDGWNGLLDQIYTTSDYEAASEYVEEVLVEFADQVPAVCLVAKDSLFAAKNNITGFYATPKLDMLYLYRLSGK